MGHASHAPPDEARRPPAAPPPPRDAPPPPPADADAADGVAEVMGIFEHAFDRHEQRERGEPNAPPWADEQDCYRQRGGRARMAGGETEILLVEQTVDAVP